MRSDAGGGLVEARSERINRLASRTTRVGESRGIEGFPRVVCGRTKNGDFFRNTVAGHGARQGSETAWIPKTLPASVIL